MFCCVNHNQNAVILTFVLLLDLNVNQVDAFLNIIPSKKLLALGQSLGSLFNKHVSISKKRGWVEFKIVSTLK